MTRRTPRFIQAVEPDPHRERQEAFTGLLRRPAEASPKYFYDRLGSHLFDAITELPEYYPTRTEAAIFAAHGADMARCIGAGATFVDLGAGNCAKAAKLLPLLEPVHYVAVDISADYLHDALRALQRAHPALAITGVGMDFSRSPELPPGAMTPDDSRRVFFYPGSSIGNFTPAQAEAFLAGVRAQAQGGGLLIGIDLVKPAGQLIAAYDDAIGVTAAFNLNLLERINRELDGDIDLDSFAHDAIYDEANGRIEMHLVSLARQTVRVLGRAFGFTKGERVHTENSHKYSVEEFQALASAAGWTPAHAWTDADRLFSLHLLRLA